MSGTGRYAPRLRRRGATNRRSQAMLRRVSPKVQYCLQKAVECKRLASVARQTQARDHYERLEQSWLALAEKCELTDRVTDFLTEQRRGATPTESGWSPSVPTSAQAPRSPPAAPGAALNAAPTRATGRPVAIVDDDPAVLKALERLLSA